MLVFRRQCAVSPPGMYFQMLTGTGSYLEYRRTLRAMGKPKNSM